MSRLVRALVFAAMAAAPAHAAEDALRDLMDALDRGSTPSVEAAEQGLQTAIDVLAQQSPEDHAALMDRVYDSWAAADDDSARRLALARVMCRVAPFRLSTADATEAARDRLNARFVSVWTGFRDSAVGKSYTEARFTDCASQNLAPGYFAAAAQLDRVIPYGNCATRNYSDAASLGVVRDLFAGAEKSAAPPSYYRLRAAHFARVTGIAAALADLREGNTDWDEVRAALARAGAGYLQDADDPDFVTARNGWRHRNDFLYHGIVYTLVGTEPGTEPRAAAEARLREMIQTAPVLDDDALGPVIEPWVAQDIAASAPSYVDPVSVDRLFPGLLDQPEMDCDRNRRQSLETRELARGTLECLRLEDPYAGLTALRTFDACLAGIESAVWWLQMGAYRDRAVAEKVMVGLREYLSDALRGAPVELDVIVPDARSSFYRIRTATPLTRSQVGTLADLARADKRSVLIGRETVY